jgi:hypothetical protein
VKKQRWKTTWVSGFGLAVGVFACGACSSSSSPASGGGSDGGGESHEASTGTDAGAMSDAPTTNATDSSTQTEPEAGPPATDSGGPLPGPTGIGDSCNFDSDCPQGSSCDLVCVASCTTDADCPGSHGGGRNAQGVQNRCIQTLDPTTNIVSLECWPGCNTQTECNPLGLTCRLGPDGDAGTGVNVCEMGF